MATKKFVKAENLKIGDKGKDYAGAKGKIVEVFMNFEEMKKANSEYVSTVEGYIRDEEVEENEPIVIVDMKDYGEVCFAYGYHGFYVEK